MFNTRFDYLICEYMVYCRSRQLRPKTMNSYEQGLRLFERWCQEQMGVNDVSKITENIIKALVIRGVRGSTRSAGADCSSVSRVKSFPQRGKVPQCSHWGG